MRGRWPGPWIRGILWDDENLEHVAQHGVAAEEVEEALIVCVRKGGGLVRPLTARDMTEVEKRLYRRKQRGRP
jgi:hypothetical protein